MGRSSYTILINSIPNETFEVGAGRRVLFSDVFLKRNQTSVVFDILWRNIRPVYPTWSQNHFQVCKVDPSELIGYVLFSRLIPSVLVKWSYSSGHASRKMSYFFFGSDSSPFGRSSLIRHSWNSPTSGHLVTLKHAQYLFLASVLTLVWVQIVIFRKSKSATL